MLLVCCYVHHSLITSGFSFHPWLDLFITMFHVFVKETAAFNTRKTKQNKQRKDLDQKSNESQKVPSLFRNILYIYIAYKHLQ